MFLKNIPLISIKTTYVKCLNSKDEVKLIMLKLSLTSYFKEIPLCEYENR